MRNLEHRLLCRGLGGVRKWFETPCAVWCAVAYCCGAVAPRAIAALLGRFLPRLGPPVHSPGGPFFLPASPRSFPGRDAARSSCEALLRRTGIVPNTVSATAPALQRTAPQGLRAALRPGNERRLLR